MIKAYNSKVYVGKNYDAMVHSYYGSNSYPLDFYEVIYRVHKDGTDDHYWSHRINYIYTSRTAALKTAKKISLW